MINNEYTKIQNAKDLRFYRFLVVMALLASLVIALFVGTFTIDSYEADADVTNAFINVLMPKKISGSEDGKSEELVFYREKNKDYDVKKDEPIKAFKFYMLDSKGEKIYLEDGNYYPPEYYMENSTAEPVAVNIGFYFKMMRNYQNVKKVFSVVSKVFSIIFAIGIAWVLIYAWYRSWCRREDERQAMEEEYNKRFNKKN